MIRAAEAAAFNAIVVTIDNTIGVSRVSEPLAHHDVPGGLVSALAQTPAKRLAHYGGDARATWDTFAWICQQTTLPVIAKGVITRRRRHSVFFLQPASPSAPCTPAPAR